MNDEPQPSDALKPEDVKPETFPSQTKKNPIFEGLPEYLKDPANYKKIKKQLLNELSSTHSHGEMVEWAACPSCQRKFTERGVVIRKLGFTSSAQYMAWDKVMKTIVDAEKLGRIIYPKYNKP